MASRHSVAGVILIVLGTLWVDSRSWGGEGMRGILIYAGLVRIFEHLGV